ncbi:MAG: hypothetical protein AAGK78_04455, partial [Planctomycetota bacterium]
MLLIVAAVVLMLLGALIGLGQPLILTAQLLFGWTGFLKRTVPEVRVPPESLVVGVGCLVVVVILGHVTLRWFWRETRPDAEPWRVRSSAMTLGVVLLMFVCGVAATGVAHQVGWLLHDPEPMWDLNRPGLDRLRCGSNMRQIYRALDVYALENGD